jgi:hypothetical protein
MKSIELHHTDTYPDIIAHQTINSFGDQVINIVYESVSGIKSNKEE